MKIKNILLAVAATSMALALVGCNDTFSKVEQGRTIAFN